MSETKLEIKTYSIVNPSDPYTIQSGNFAAVCVAVSLLGGGKYGLQSADGELVMPLFIFGGGDDWFKEKFGTGFEDTHSTLTPQELADVFDSVLIGSFEDRLTYEGALALIDDADKRKQWERTWKDARRTSVNDIGARAENYAEFYRGMK